MVYCESLPDECPPNDAKDDELVGFVRLVETLPPTETDFQSHAILQPDKKPKTVDDCRWASLSLISSQKADTLLKTSRHRSKQKLAVTVQKGFGRWKGNESHVDFWRYATVPYGVLVA
jgi:hypothetical protein